MNAIGRYRRGGTIVLGILPLVFGSTSFAVAIDSTWTGSAGDQKWITPGNWNNNEVPKMAGDKATINIRNTTVTLDKAQNITPTLDQFLVDEGGARSGSTRVTIAGVTFTVNGAADIKKARTLRLEDMTWDGTGTLSNTIPLGVGSLYVVGDVHIKSSFAQQGAVEIAGGEGGAARKDANLTVDKDFTNSGRLRFTQVAGNAAEAELIVGTGAGVLTNTGKIEFEPSGEKLSTERSGRRSKTPEPLPWPIRPRP